MSVLLKLLIAAQNQPRTRLNSDELPLTMLLARKSAMEYSPVPQSKSFKRNYKLLYQRKKVLLTSNSFSSKILNKLSGMIPFKPFKKLSISSFTLLHSLCCARESKY